MVPCNYLLVSRKHRTLILPTNLLHGTPTQYLPGHGRGTGRIKLEMDFPVCVHIYKFRFFIAAQKWIGGGSNVAYRAGTML